MPRLSISGIRTLHSVIQLRAGRLSVVARRCRQRRHTSGAAGTAPDPAWLRLERHPSDLADIGSVVTLVRPAAADGLR
jgi:hypothetical protein